MEERKLMIGAALGSCVHVAGIIHFLDLARDNGYDTVFLGPACSVEHLVDEVRRRNPTHVAVGYRLTPENAVTLVRQLARQAPTDPGITWIFGGTGPVAAAIAPLGFFDVIFDGTEDQADCLCYLRTGRRDVSGDDAHFAGGLVSRIDAQQPYPLLRHHFGLPDFEQTRQGIAAIAKSRVLDVVSLGIDQQTQQFFFHPEQRLALNEGAGGVPVHDAEQFRALKAASQTGNYPLMRCYSGTADVMAMGRMLVDTIDNAWCAVPLCWYSELDGRGTRPVATAMAEAQQLMRWHAQAGIPVEVNEPHHWGLRDAPDVISVAMAYVSAYNAKKAGVKDYVAQYMFNIPAALSSEMDLAKVLAQDDLVTELAGEGFHVWREVRAGLPLLSADEAVAKGQLASSTMLAMAIRPHIIHVVGYSEANRAADAAVVIESCRIVRGVIRSSLYGGIEMEADPTVAARRAELKEQASYLLSYINRRYAAVSTDPLADPAVIADCIRIGILDAPHILRKPGMTGERIHTRMIAGRCMACDASGERPLTEQERLASFDAQPLLGLERRYANDGKHEDSGHQRRQRRPDDGGLSRPEGL